MANLTVNAVSAPHLRLSVHVENLTNTLGLTEGNPRAGSFDTGGTANSYFLARPEFGRTIRSTLSLTY